MFVIMITYLLFECTAQHIIPMYVYYIDIFFIYFLVNGAWRAALITIMVVNIKLELITLAKGYYIQKVCAKRILSVVIAFG